MSMSACTKISRYARGVSGNRLAVATRIGTAMKIGKTSSTQVPGSSAPMREMARQMTPTMRSASGSLRRVRAPEESASPSLRRESNLERLQERRGTARGRGCTESLEADCSSLQLELCIVCISTRAICLRERDACARRLVGELAVLREPPRASQARRRMRSLSLAQFDDAAGVRRSRDERRRAIRLRDRRQLLGSRARKVRGTRRYRYLDLRGKQLRTV